MEEVELPEADLIWAGFSLFFCPPGRWSEVWPKVRAAVRPGGRFGGQILGERDTWASEQEISSFSREDGRALFDGFEIERFEEEEEYDEASAGTKNWLSEFSIPISTAATATVTRNGSMIRVRCIVNSSLPGTWL